jgi:hypothetical protein
MLSRVNRALVVAFLLLFGGFGCLVLIWPKVAWLQIGRGSLGKRSPVTKAKLDAVPGSAAWVMRIVGLGFVLFSLSALWSLLKA